VILNQRGGMTTYSGLNTSMNLLFMTSLCSAVVLWEGVTMTEFSTFLTSRATATRYVKFPAITMWKE